jgi:hypothetical protein
MRWKAAGTHRLGNGALRLAEVEEQGMLTWGLPRNLGGPSASIGHAGVGEAGPEFSRPPGEALERLSGANSQAGRWYSAASNEAAQDESRESEQVVVAMKSGNVRAERTRWSQGLAGSRNCRWDTPRALWGSINGAHATPADSIHGRRGGMLERSLLTEEPDALIAHVRICGGPRE